MRTAASKSGELHALLALAMLCRVTEVSTERHRLLGRFFGFQADQFFGRLGTGWVEQRS